MASSTVLLHWSSKSKKNILRYLSAKGDYRSIDQISKQMKDDPSNTEKATRELLSLGMVKQVAKSASSDSPSYKIAFRGEMALTSILQLCLFALLGIVTVFGALANLGSLPVMGVLLAGALALFIYVYFAFIAMRSLRNEKSQE